MARVKVGIETFTTLPPHPLSSIEIAARHELEPYQQGSLDGLCGLYAAVNGLRLALHPYRQLNRHAVKRLFHSGVEYLERKGWLGDVIQHGMGEKRWRRLVRHIAKQVQTFDLVAHAEPASFEKPVTVDSVFAWIVDSLAMGTPVLASFGGYLDHYSVIVAIDDSRLHLFDSSGFQHVLRASCGIDTGRHQIVSSSLLRIVIEPPG